MKFDFSDSSRSIGYSEIFDMMRNWFFVFNWLLAVLRILSRWYLMAFMLVKSMLELGYFCSSSDAYDVYLRMDLLGLISFFLTILTVLNFSDFGYT